MWEHRYLYKARSFAGTATTETFDLPERGKLSALLFVPLWTNAVGGDNSLNVTEMFTKIEIVHRGSEVVKSLTGKQAVGVAATRGYHYHDLQVSHKATGTQQVIIPLLFGRYLLDAEFGLDLAQLSNPQLKLTYNYAYGTSNDASGAFSGTAGTFDLEMVFAPDTQPFAHYLKTSEVYTWTPTAGATEIVDLPRGKPWARVFVQSVDNDYPIWNSIEEITLNLETGRLKPWNVKTVSLVVQNMRQFGPFVNYAYWGFPNQASILYDPMVGYVVGLYPNTAEAAGHGPMVYGRLYANRKTIYVEAANEAGECSLGGGAVGNLLCLPFDVPAIGDALQSGQFSRIELECAANSAASSPGESAVILEEIV